MTGLTFLLMQDSVFMLVKRSYLNFLIMTLILKQYQINKMHLRHIRTSFIHIELLY